MAKLNEKVVGLQQWQALLQQVIYLYSITHLNTLLEYVFDWWAFKDFVDKITFFNASTVKWWETQDYDDFVFTYGHHWINEQNFELISSPTTWIEVSPIFTVASLHNLPFSAFTMRISLFHFLFFYGIMCKPTEICKSWERSKVCRSSLTCVIS